MAIEHKNIPEAERHEPKGASTATAGQVLTSNGDGTTQFQGIENLVGWWNYDDSATATTPILLLNSGVRYNLTNDTLGSNNITTYGLPGVGLWNPSTNKLDFSNLEVGDMVDIRVDIVVTNTTANNDFLLEMQLAEGDPIAFYLPLDRVAYRSSGTYQWAVNSSIFIGSEQVRANPGGFTLTTDNGGSSVVVNGWYIRAMKRST